MQGLADGYFVIPYTLVLTLSKEIATKADSTDHPAFVEAENEVKERNQ
jgi:succinate dehydrogenase / fumarate reductase flavoprotein subunit